MGTTSNDFAQSVPSGNREPDREAELIRLLCNPFLTYDEAVAEVGVVRYEVRDVVKVVTPSGSGSRVPAAA